MSDDTSNKTPLGFNVQPTGDGKFALAVTGISPWYMTGFENPTLVHEWVCEYLTTMSENMMRVNIDATERAAEVAREMEVKRMEILAQYPVKGKPN